MQIIKETITKIKKFRTYIFQFQYQHKMHYARQLISEWDVEHLLDSEALVLQLGKDFYLLGYNGQTKDHYTEYMLGKQLIIREYFNGNLAGLRKGHIDSTPAIFSFESNQQILYFDSTYLAINVDCLPAKYLVEKRDNSEYKVRRLLSNPEFCSISGVNRRTLLDWIKAGKFTPTRKNGCHAYFTHEQIRPAQIRHNSLTNSKAMQKIIINVIHNLEVGIVIHLNFFKQMIPGYNYHKITTLRMVLQKLLDEKILERTSRAYYKINNIKL